MVDQELVLEQVKQITLDFFFSYFIKRDLDRVMRYTSDTIKWSGSKTSLVAHSQAELRNLLIREAENIPPNCVIKLVRIEAVQVVDECYSVTGELEVRMPYLTQIRYSTLSFMSTLLCTEGRFFISTLHTFMSGDGLSAPDEEKTENSSVNRMVSDMDEKSQYDYLSGLYTLDYFKDTVRLYLDQIRDNRKYALLYTDISNFEKLNNLYGLQKADSVLLDLAGLLTSFSKRVVYCCRSVADHFLLLIEIDNEKSVQKDILHLCRDFDATISGRFPEAILKLGVGAYILQDNKMSIDKMVEHANVARKSLRFPSSSRVAFYDHKVFTQVEKVKRIEKSMERALHEGEFKVYVQPKFHLVTKEIVGAEALVRWIRPDKSMVYPDEFIPVFEKNGFIKQVDFYMLEQICKWIQGRLKNECRCVPISVNQSRYLLKSSTYTEDIASVLRKYNTPPELIELELTERLFTDKLGEMADMMEQLKSIGVRWSIDDFGTGYSSLNLLKELPVDIIKIDKTFLDETENSRASRVIIQKTVELTKELNKTVVCEGVETEAQANYLKEIQCEVAQGYLYARPMPIKEFEALLDVG